MARKYGYTWGVDPGMGLSNPYSKIHDCFPNLPKSDLSGVRFHEHPAAICPQHNQHFNDCHFDYHELPNLGPNVVMTGFFQSWKYFKDVQDEVKKVFELPHVPGYEDYVSIHVRRGDYLQHSGSFPPVTLEYIGKAIGMFLIGYKFNSSGGMDFPPKHFSNKFMVFSDDIEWCKQNIKAKENDIFNCTFEYSEGRNTFDDWSLMASCGHHIIANSTYSFWGAYLGHNPDRIVISPSPETWFGPTAGVKKPVVDLLPENWIKIHTR